MTLSEPYRQQAADLALGLETGLDTVADAVAWADRLLADPGTGYDNDLAEVSLGIELSPAEMRFRLLPLCNPDDEWPAMRRLLDRLHRRLSIEGSGAERFAAFIHERWTRSGVNIPSDLRPVYNAACDYLYAEDMDGGSREIGGPGRDLDEPRRIFLRALRGEKVTPGGEPTPSPRNWLYPAGKSGRVRLLIYACILVAFPLGYWLWSPGLIVTDGRHDLGRNGLWIGHGWLGGDEWFARHGRDPARFDDPVEAERLLAQAAELHITDLFAHLCPSEPDGRLPALDEKRVTVFLDAARRQGGASLRVFLWVGGVLDGNAFPDDPAWRARFVTDARAALERFPYLAGVQVNIEPCPSGHAGFLTLLEEMRAVLPEGKLLSVAAYPPPTWWHPHPEVHWEEEYFRAVAARCDQMAVMMYDAGQRLRKPYIRLMADWTREVLAWAGDTPVLLGVPVYGDADSGYHDPAVENLENALAGIHAGLALRGGARAPYQGAAVYAEWEWDGTERRAWKTRFLRPDAINQPPRGKP